uniref:Cholecystokinin receptor type A n=1 Tax=Schizaphis graminum TaxID=13262 RepID=A0A2S2NAD3_SCHGA
MANGSGGGGGFEALQNVAPNVFPPIYIPAGHGSNGTNAVNFSEAIEREYVEDYVFQSAFSFVYLLIFTLGVFGNVLVVYVVWANKHMRTVTNIFIVNLAVSDIMLCGLAVPFTPLYTFTGVAVGLYVRKTAVTLLYNLIPNSHQSSVFLFFLRAGECHSSE